MTNSLLTKYKANYCSFQLKPITRLCMGSRSGKVTHNEKLAKIDTLKLKLNASKC